MSKNSIEIFVDEAEYGSCLDVATLAATMGLPEVGLGQIQWQPCPRTVIGVSDSTYLSSMYRAYPKTDPLQSALLTRSIKGLLLKPPMIFSSYHLEYIRRALHCCVALGGGGGGGEQEEKSKRLVCVLAISCVHGEDNVSCSSIDLELEAWGRWRSWSKHSILSGNSEQFCSYHCVFTISCCRNPLTCSARCCEPFKIWYLSVRPSAIMLCKLGLAEVLLLGLATPCQLCWLWCVYVVCSSNLQGFKPLAKPYLQARFALVLAMQWVGFSLLISGAMYNTSVKKSCGLLQSSSVYSAIVVLRTRLVFQVGLLCFCAYSRSNQWMERVARPATVAALPATGTFSHL
ncbi:hypothetical protein SDJN03_04353, partial [Cucurbita argyrosperma subsp. sororia]